MYSPSSFWCMLRCITSDVKKILNDYIKKIQPFSNKSAFTKNERVYYSMWDKLIHTTLNTSVIWLMDLHVSYCVSGCWYCFVWMNLGWLSQWVFAAALCGFNWVCFGLCLAFFFFSFFLLYTQLIRDGGQEQAMTGRGLPVELVATSAA